MAGRTENTSPIVTQAAPTDTNTEEISSEKTVQSAQAPAAVQVASPGRGAEDFIAVEAGRTYKPPLPIFPLYIGRATVLPSVDAEIAGYRAVQASSGVRFRLLHQRGEGGFRNDQSGHGAMEIGTD